LAKCFFEGGEVLGFGPEGLAGLCCYAYEAHAPPVELRGSKEKVVDARMGARDIAQETKKLRAAFWTTAPPHPMPFSFPVPVAGRAMMFP
jgi:hypothetical protein